jgi:hypothetical protein
MSGKAYEMVDLIMAIENLGHEMKKANEQQLQIKYFYSDILERIDGSLELIALAMQGVYK